VFHVAAIPRLLRTWETTEDFDKRLIQTLARHIRESPLLPLRPGLRLSGSTLVETPTLQICKGQYMFMKS